MNGAVPDLVRFGDRIGYDRHAALARHFWHGDAKHRQYVTRDEIDVEYQLDSDSSGEPNPATGLTLLD